MSVFFATYYSPTNRDGIPVQVTVWPNTIEIQLPQTVNANVIWHAKHILPLEGKMLPLYLKHKQGNAMSYLKFEDLAILNSLCNYQAFRSITTPSKHWVKLLVGVLLVFFLFIVAIGTAIYVYAPRLIESMASKMPVATEIQLGNQLFEQTKSEFVINDEQSKVAQQFFDSLYFESRFPIRIHVVKSNEINAFAMPGGHIVIYDSILHTMQSSGELAALMAHEFTHVAKHHSTRTMLQMIGTYGMLSSFFGDVSWMNAMIVGRANELLNMSYSRNFEQEADQEAVRLLVHRGIHPNGMVQLLEHLKTAETIAVPQFLSTHPLTENRIEYIQETIQKQSFSVQPASNLDSLFNQLR